MLSRRRERTSRRRFEQEERQRYNGGLRRMDIGVQDAG